MGCHTWFYRRVAEQPSDSELIAQFTEVWTKTVQEYETYVKNGGIDGTDDWGAFESEGALIETIQKLKWMLNNVSSFRSFKPIYDADLEAETEFIHKEGELYYLVVYGWEAPTLDGDGSLTTCHNGIYYKERRLHDLFRYVQYDTYFETKEETLRFIKEKSVKISKENKGKLLKFWEDYPNGLIELG
jgi:hypothetical protein